MIRTVGECEVCALTSKKTVRRFLYVINPYWIFMDLLSLKLNHYLKSELFALEILHYLVKVQKLD